MRRLSNHYAGCECVESLRLRSFLCLILFGLCILSPIFAQTSLTNAQSSRNTTTYVIDTGSGEKVCLDPYAVSMAAFCNDGTPGRAAVVDIHSDKAIPCQCRDISACCDMPDVVANSMQCGSDENTAKCSENTTKCGASYANNGGKTFNSGVCRGTDAIVYEVSIRDATINPDGSGGTYNAFQKRLDYLARLGVTHIQLMPVLNFYYNDELNKKFEAGDSTQNNNYNWGYDPHWCRAALARASYERRHYDTERIRRRCDEPGDSARRSYPELRV